MKDIRYSDFQEASIQAAVRHFQKHDRVLCADEAGLGKTIIARGIIERMAEQKLEQEYKRCGRNLAAWWEAFRQANRNYGYARHQREAMDDFQNICRLNVAIRRDNGRAKKCADIMEEIGKVLQTTVPDLERFGAVVKNLPRLIMMRNATGRQRDWDLRLPVEEGHCTLPAEPFRVLYVCCNLDIARQNTRRLTPLAQNSDRGTEGRPDRLSVLWYYLQRYPTPFLEIMPVTATISTRQTQGNTVEKRILKESEIQPATREKAEQKSLELYYPDLVIFDEFQNFADIPSLCNKSDDAFEQYLKTLSGDDANQREAALRRTRRIFATLMHREKPPKLLILSATPFHTVQYRDDAQRENVNQIDLGELLTFLGGSRAGLEQAADREAYLYDTCGIFRNERIRLLQRDNAACHVLECDGDGLLAPALRLHGEGAGNCARRAVFTTPHIDRVCQMYDKNVGSYCLNPLVSVEPFDHPRSRRLLQVVTAREPDKLDAVEQPQAAEALAGLLWLPPVRHSRQPLRGKFAGFEQYSKTLVYSDLKVTPGSVTDILNGSVRYLPLHLEEKERAKVEHYLADCLNDAGIPEQRDSIAAKLCRYLLNHGGRAVEEATAEAVIRYCQDGCLTDVLREYNDLLEDPDDSTVVWNALARDQNPVGFACPMGTVTPELRGVFNAPFLPFVLMTTSIGAEGLDFHLYCNRLAHYTMPSSVVELEQKNGRIDRYNSLAVRRSHAQPMTDRRTARELEQRSGGLAPMWDAGEGNLHYYFFCTQFTGERKRLQALRREQKCYREQLGAHRQLRADTCNLCPWLRRGAGK